MKVNPIPIIPYGHAWLAYGVRPKAVALSFEASPQGLAVPRSPGILGSMSSSSGRLLVLSHAPSEYSLNGTTKAVQRVSASQEGAVISCTCLEAFVPQWLSLLTLLFEHCRFPSQPSCAHGATSSAALRGFSVKTGNSFLRIDQGYQRNSKPA